jgi:uncharacterized protein YkwD
MPPPDGLIDTVDAEMLRLMNLARAERGVAPLLPHLSLLVAARSHAIDMAGHNRLSHYGLADHSTWAERCDEAGYPGASLITINENVGKGAMDAETMISDYRKSPGHWRQIVDPENVHAASAMSVGSDGLNYWCTDFGKSKEA